MTFVFIYHLEIQSEIPKVILLRTHLIIGDLFQIDQCLVDIDDIFLESGDFKVHISADLLQLNRLEMLSIFVNNLFVTLIYR